MAHEYRPGTKMHEIVWERGSKCVGKYYVHAASETDAISHAEAFFAEYPEHDFGRDGTTINVRIVPDF
jgi:hypothetical protein